MAPPSTFTALHTHPGLSGACPASWHHRRPPHPQNPTQEVSAGIPDHPRLDAPSSPLPACPCLDPPGTLSLPTPAWTLPETSPCPSQCPGSSVSRTPALARVGLACGCGGVRGQLPPQLAPSCPAGQAQARFLPAHQCRPGLMELRDRGWSCGHTRWGSVATRSVPSKGQSRRGNGVGALPPRLSGYNQRKPLPVPTAVGADPGLEIQGFSGGPPKKPSVMG